MKVEDAKKYSELSAKERKNLLTQLYERDGTKCHYCGIEEKEFTCIWEKPFYGKGTRGRRLEVEHKDGNDRNNSLENLVLACSLCNMAKSDVLTYEEFKKVGNAIREIWQQRKLVKFSQSGFQQ